MMDSDRKAPESEALRFPSGPGEGLPLHLEYETPRPIGQSTLGPPTAMTRALWWVSYRVGRAMGCVLAKPQRPRRRD